MQCFDDPRTQIATLGKPFESMEAVENPNSPKIVLDNDGYALYFSRSVIPFVRGKESNRVAHPFSIPQTHRTLRLPHRSATRSKSSATVFT